MLAAVGCAPLDSADESATDQDLFGDPSRFFPTSADGFTRVPVCWTFPGYDADKRLVRDAVETQWGLASSVVFVGWDACDPKSSAPAIRISQADVNPITHPAQPIGANMTLNFTYRDWTSYTNQNCQCPWYDPACVFHSATSYRQGCDYCGSNHAYCDGVISLHEFGHALGMYHEQQRPENASGQYCAQFQDGESIAPGGQAFGSYDTSSIMNYCSTWDRTTPVISPGDASGLKQAYGPRPFSTLAYTDPGGWGSSPSYWKTIKYADLNNDGKADVCGRASDGLYCALSNGTTFDPPSFWTTSYSDRAGWSAAESYWGTLAFVDLDGDHKADVCGRASDGLYCALSNGKTFNPPSFWTTSFSDATGWTHSDSYWRTIKYADLNGDGKADVCGRGGDGVYCALSNGTSFGPLWRWTSAYSDGAGWSAAESNWGTLELVDLNGDGKADICGRASDGLYCALSNGTSFGTPSFWTTSFSDGAGWTGSDSYWRTIRYADLDGDGKADVCGRASDGLYCALSTGASFAPPSFWTRSYSNGAGWTVDSYWRTIQFPDLNGDGKADVCGRAASGLYCAFSSGSSFTSPMLLDYQYSDLSGWASRESNWGTIRFPDLDGDGRADVSGHSADGLFFAYRP